MRKWPLLPKRQRRDPMSSRHVLPIRISSSLQMLLRIAMPSGLGQSNCPGTIVGHTCTGCRARLTGCRWFRHQQMEKEQAKEVQRTSCAGERWPLRISISADNWNQFAASVAYRTWRCIASVKCDTYPSATLHCAYTSKQWTGRQHGRLRGR